MKVKRIKLKSYGPIDNLDITPAQGLQIIFGKNETGKTLTVDAIILLLSGLKIKEIDRVGELPDGEVVIENNGKIIAISRKTRKPIDYLSVEDPYDLRNIFIIRNSDLRIDNEADLMRRLVGIEGVRINKVRESLLRLGRLSEKRLELSDRYDRIKQRYETSQDLIGEIKAYLKEASKKKVETLEISVAQLSDEIKKVDERIRVLEDAKKAEDYERLKKALSDYQAAHRKCKELDLFNPGQLDLLTRYQNTLNKKEEDLEMKNSDIVKKESRQKELLEKKERVFAELPEKSIEEDVIKIKEGFEKLPIPLPENLLWRLPYVFIPLLAIFILFYFLSGIKVLTIIFGAGGIGLTGFFLYGLFRSASIEMKKKRLIDKAKRIGMVIEEEKVVVADTGEAGDILNNVVENEGEEKKAKDNNEDLIPVLQEFSEEVRKKVNSLNRIEAELKILTEEIGDDRLTVHRLNKEISATREHLTSEFRKLGIHKLEDFYNKMEDLKNTEKRLAESRQSLIDYFKSDDPSVWQKGVDDLHHDLTEIKEPYSPLNMDRLKEDRRKKGSEVERIKALLDDHRGRLKEFERRIGKLQIFSESDPDLSIETLDGLKRVSTILKDFNNEVEKDANAARVSINILAEVSNEHETKLTDILSNRFNASDVFREVTSGRYKKIKYNSEKRGYTIIQHDGSERSLRQLSKGTFDQLYLSIRIAIAEGISDGPRFLIMDDPFLTSDRERLITQFEVLKKFVDRGWQIIYFTVKDEVVEISRNYTKNRVIELISRT